jgi:membrane protein YqaA with SNARE-associated domain
VTLPQMNRTVTYTLVLLMVLGWSVALYFITPEAIVSRLGAQALTAVFVAGVLGGTSILFPFPYYLVVATAAAGGANPVLVGLCAGVGVMLGDTTSYLVGHAGRAVLPAKASEAFALLHRWVSDTHSVKFYGFLFVYGCVMPLPNDVIVMPLGAAGVPYWRVILPLAAGNIVFNTGTALLAAHGLAWFWT